MTTTQHQSDVQAAAAALVAAMDAFRDATLAASKVDPDFLDAKDFSVNDFFVVDHDARKQVKKLAA
jgi:hypothetical protein